MKLSRNTDFTRIARAGAFVRAADLEPDGSRPKPVDVAILAHDERHLRRKVLELVHGEKLLVDLPEPVMLHSHDVLVLDDGRHAEIIAGEEELLEIRARNRLHLSELCWHIGNRHLAAQIEEDRILILRDHVIKAMLEGLGAAVADVVEPFDPVRGAYSGHSHGHHHGTHDHNHGDGHHHHRHE